MANAATSACSSHNTATGLPTGMSSAPSGTSTLATHPSSMDSISIVALSVWISARMSPAATNSPSFFFHEAMPPWVMVGEREGKGTIWWGGRSASAAKPRVGRATDAGRWRATGVRSLEEGRKRRGRERRRESRWMPGWGRRSGAIGRDARAAVSRPGATIRLADGRKRDMPGSARAIAGSRGGSAAEKARIVAERSRGNRGNDARERSRARLRAHGGRSSSPRAVTHLCAFATPDWDAAPAPPTRPA